MDITCNKKGEHIMGIEKVLKKVGNGYRIQQIDFENCLYKDLGKYDIEVSGLNDLKQKHIKVFVWEKNGLTTDSPYQNGMNIVYKSKRLTTIEELKMELKKVESEFKTS
jgi:hypothetical protein